MEVIKLGVQCFIGCLLSIHDMYVYMKVIILSRAEGGCYQGITLQVIHTHIILSMPRWHIRPLQKQSTRQMPISGSGSRSSQTLLIPFLLNFFSPYDSFSLPLFLFPVGVYLMTTLGMAFDAILLMYPIHCHLLLLTLTDSGIVSNCSAVEVFLGDGSWPQK